MATFLSTVSLSGNYHDCRPLYVGTFDEQLNASSYVVVCARGSVIQVVSSSSGAILGTLKGHTDAGFVTAMGQLTATADSTQIVSASNDGKICIWNLVSATDKKEVVLGERCVA